MTVSLPLDHRSVWSDPFAASWNRILEIGKARAARASGSADMRFGVLGAGEVLVIANDGRIEAEGVIRRLVNTNASCAPRR
jgi:hypothetical protein